MHRLRYRGGGMEVMSSFRRFWRNAPGIADKTEVIQMAAVATQGLVMLLGIIRAMVVVRLLGPDNYGLVGLTIAVGGVFNVIQHLGLGVGAAKEAAQAADRQQLGPVAVVVLGVRFALLLPLLALLTLVAAPLAAATYHLPELESLILLYALVLLLSSPGDILGYLLTGSDRFRVYFFLLIFKEIFTTVAVLLMIPWLGIRGYFIGQALAGLVNTVLSATAVWRAIGQSFICPSRDEARELLRSVFKTSLAVYLAKSMRSFSGQVPMLVGGLFLPTSALGWLRFGLQTGGYFSGLMSSIAMVTLPRMTRVRAIHGRDFLLREFASNFQRVAWGVGVLLVPAVVLAPEIVRFGGGAGFINAWPAVQLVLIFYAFITLADNIFAGIYFPLDWERSYVLAYAVLLAVSMVGVVIFVPWMRSAESTVLGLTAGGAALMVAAIWQTRGLPMLPGRLARSTAAVLIVAGLSLLSAVVRPLGWRLVIVVVGMSSILADIWHTDGTAQRLIRFGVERALSAVRSRS